MEVLLSLLLIAIGLGIPLIAVAGMGLARAVVFATLWGWFVVPTLHVQPIGLVAAWGLMVVLGFVFPKGTESLQDQSKFEAAMQVHRALPEGKEKQASAWALIGVVFNQWISTLFRYAALLGVCYFLKSYL